MQKVDQLIAARWVIPMDQAQSILEEQTVVVDKGVIIDITDTDVAKDQYQSDNLSKLDNCALLPGFVNTHTHAAMTLFRGYADDLPLMQWLSEHIWPAESKWVDEAFIEAGADLAFAEMILGGTTCFNDMYFFPNVVARRAQLAGIRGCVGMIVIDFPTVWAKDADEYLTKGLAMRDEIRHSNLLTAAFAPHAPYTVSDQPLEKISTLAEELDCQIHIHLHETAHEVSESMARYGVRPIERMGQLGLLGPRLMAVHMTQLLDGEIETIANRGVHVVHCPESNLKLASGFCPINKLSEAGVNIAIGTDGASSNNDLDMLGEARTASLLAKGTSEDPTVLSAHETLYAATINGAKAMGLDHLIGSIEIGKQADLISIDLSHCNTQPVFNPVSQIVYSAGRNQVSNVWINGNQVLNDYQLTQIDQDRVCQVAAEWRDRIK